MNFSGRLIPWQKLILIAALSCLYSGSIRILALLDGKLLCIRFECNKIASIRVLGKLRRKLVNGGRLLNCTIAIPNDATAAVYSEPPRLDRGRALEYAILQSRSSQG